MPAIRSRMAGAILVRRATSAVPATIASRIRKIWNLASSMPSHSPGSRGDVNAPVAPTGRTRAGFNRFLTSLWPAAATAHSMCSLARGSLVPHVVAIGFRDDPPAVGQVHRDEVVGEVARRNLASHLHERRLVGGAVDGDDESLERLAFCLGRGALADAVEPLGHLQELQFTLLDPAEIGAGVEDGAHLVGVAFVQGV